MEDIDNKPISDSQKEIIIRNFIFLNPITELYNYYFNFVKFLNITDRIKNETPRKWLVDMERIKGFSDESFRNKLIFFLDERIKEYGLDVSWKIYILSK